MGLQREDKARRRKGELGPCKSSSTWERFASHVRCVIRGFPEVCSPGTVGEVSRGEKAQAFMMQG